MCADSYRRTRHATRMTSMWNFPYDFNDACPDSEVDRAYNETHSKKTDLAADADRGDVCARRATGVSLPYVRDLICSEYLMVRGGGNADGRRSPSPVRPHVEGVPYTADDPCDPFRKLPVRRRSSRPPTPMPKEEKRCHPNWELKLSRYHGWMDVKKKPDALPPVAGASRKEARDGRRHQHPIAERLSRYKGWETVRMPARPPCTVLDKDDLTNPDARCVCDLADLPGPHCKCNYQARLSWMHGWIIVRKPKDVPKKKKTKVASDDSSDSDDDDDDLLAAEKILKRRQKNECDLEAYLSRYHGWYLRKVPVVKPWQRKLIV